MAGKRTALARKATALPAKYTRGFAWQLDQRCQAAREVATDLMTLWQDLGGLEALSAQQQWLVERVVFMRRRMLAFETAVLSGTDPPMTAGEYSNFANVCVGHLKALGLERKAKAVGLSTWIAGKAKSANGAEEVPCAQ